MATWKRQVAERCIFGVDLNELAVELAKLCLWMTTAAKGKPLTFLDHHLRWGNSLVGAWLKDVGIYPLAKRESEEAFTLPLERFQVNLDEVLAAYETLYAKSSDDVNEVREKARIFDEEIYPALQPYRELLDLHTGVYFGNGLDETAYAQLGAAMADPADWMRVKTLGLGGLLSEYENQHWFHWELEFLEVFAGARRGFDVVVGNPPYVDVSTDAYTTGHYEFASARNLYAYMLEQSGNVIGTGDFLGMIVPMSLAFSSRMQGLREWFKGKATRVRVAHFGIRPAEIFPGVDQRATIVVAKTKDNAGQMGQLESTRFNRSRAGEETQLLRNLTLTDITDFPAHLAWAMLGDEIRRGIAG